MILSNTAEFTPWVVQPKKENQFTELIDLSRSDNSEKQKDEDGLTASKSLIADELDDQQFDETAVYDDEESVSQKVTETETA